MKPMTNEFHWHYCRVKIEQLFDAYRYFYDNPGNLPYTEFPAGWRVTPGEDVNIKE